MTDPQHDHFVNLILKLLSNEAPLDTIFNDLIEYFEDLNPKSICSILFLDSDKKRFYKTYAPHLPDFYNQAILKETIGPKNGSCGTAAFLGERVIVKDIAHDPLWEAYRTLAKEAGLASCWSQPIKNKSGEVLGTFAIYHRELNAPTDKHIRSIEQAANLVSIVLQHFETKAIAKVAQESMAIIYESSIDAMWLVDIEDNGKTYRFKSVNKAFKDISGLHAENMIGRNIEDVLPQPSLDRVREKYEQAVKTGQIVDYLAEVDLPVGIKSVHIRIKPIKDEKGTVTKILGIAEDITEQKKITDRLKESEADLIHAQHVARLGSWKWDGITKNIYWSKEIYNILNLDPSTEPVPIEEQIKLYTDESWNKLRLSVSEAIANDTSYEIDLEGRTSEGQKPRWFIARGMKLKKDSEGNALFLTGTLQDNTERKILENHLKDALVARDQFIAVATHELKTPLSTLQLTLHSVLRLLDSVIDTEKVKSKIEKAKSQTTRLESLIKNLLDVTSIGAGKMLLDLKPQVDLSQLVDNIIKRYDETIVKSGSILHKNIDSNIIGYWDEFRLEQVIINLLTNAVKYGDGKPIEIHLYRKNNCAVLEVRDQGIGIPEDKQNKVFERFERAVSETNYSGLGLGLWIVREIVTALDGKVWVRSTLHKGSCFTVELPIKEHS